MNKNPGMFYYLDSLFTQNNNNMEYVKLYEGFLNENLDTIKKQVLDFAEKNGKSKWKELHTVILKQKGYKLVQRLNRNCWYIPKEITSPSVSIVSKIKLFKGLEAPLIHSVSKF